MLRPLLFLLVLPLLLARCSAESYLSFHSHSPSDNPVAKSTTATTARSATRSGAKTHATSISSPAHPIIVIAGEYGRYTNQLIAVSQMLWVSLQVPIREIVLPRFGRAYDVPSTFLSLTSWKPPSSSSSFSFTKLSEDKAIVSEGSRIAFVCDDLCRFSNESLSHPNEKELTYDVLNIGTKWRMDYVSSLKRKLFIRTMNEFLKIISLYDIVVIHGRAAFFLHSTILKHKNITTVTPDEYLPVPMFNLYNKDVIATTTSFVDALFATKSSTSKMRVLYCAHIRRGDLKRHYPLQSMIAQVKVFYAQNGFDHNHESHLVLFTDADEEELALLKRTFPHAAIGLPEELLRNRNEAFELSVIHLTATKADYFIGYKPSSFSYVIGLNRRSLDKNTTWFDEPFYYIDTDFKDDRPTSKPILAIAAGTFAPQLTFANQLLAFSNLLWIAAKIDAQAIVAPKFGPALDLASSFLDLATPVAGRTKITQDKINLQPTQRFAFVCDFDCEFTKEAINNPPKDFEFDVYNIGKEWRIGYRDSLRNRYFIRDTSKFIRVLSYYDIIIFHYHAAFSFHNTLLSYHNESSVPPEYFTPPSRFYTDNVTRVSIEFLQSVSTRSPPAPIYCVHVRRGTQKDYMPLDSIITQVSSFLSNAEPHSPLLVFTDAEQDELAALKQHFAQAIFGVPAGLVQDRTKAFELAVIQLTASKADHFLGCRNSSLSYLIALNRRSFGKETQWLKDSNYEESKTGPD